ncbi:pyrroline-5-carboxylate reductase [Patescibacteria group bacterium]|nr:pyrroline-5-carboxylate reductase [Patescibacteria group bacterium]
MQKLAIIGCGIMGSAILEALLREKVFPPSRISAIDADEKKLAKLKKKFGVKVAKNATEAVEKADVILLAVKPQNLASVCQNWKTEKLVISILAGAPIANLQKATGSQKIARAMPNTPAKIGAGISGWFASKNVSKTEKILVRKILASFGKEVELRNEKMLNTVTAISGSGPAYFFVFAEALEKVARKFGLGKLAPIFVRQTFLGAAKLAEAAKISFSELRKNVTSKGGTTEAALKVFEKKKFGKIVEIAAKAAKKRSEKLKN